MPARKPPPAPALPPHLADPLVAVLCEIDGKCAAAQSAVRNGRLAWARTWIDEILAASPRLAVAADRALPRSTL